MNRQFRHIPSPQHATFEIPTEWQRVNSCALCGVKSIVPLVISMTLCKTKSLRLRNDSTMALISFTKVAREAGAISFWLAYSSNITVSEALALSEGEININKTSRSFFAA